MAAKPYDDPSTPIPNSRREKYAQNLAGATFESDLDAYNDAGFTGDKAAASRCKDRADVQMRVAWIQGEAAKETIVTIQSTTAELEDARQKAITKNDPNTMRQCSMDKAKVNGLVVDKRLVGVKDVKDWTEDELNAFLGNA